MHSSNTTEWDNMLDTGDILSTEDPIPVVVSLPELPDLFSSAEDWDAPTRAVAIHPRQPLESGIFRRSEPQPSILDAALFVTELGRRHDALHARIRSFETLGLMTQDPDVRAAWATLSGRFAELGRLVDTLRALYEGATVRGALELYMPSHPLAAFLDGAYTYAERVLTAFGKLGSQLIAAQPDWQAFGERVNEARSWLVRELLEEALADLALMALQLGDKPVAEVSRRLRRAALVLTDIDAMIVE